jgi:hypothetical protein
MDWTPPVGGGEEFCVCKSSLQKILLESDGNTLVAQNTTQ